MSELLQFIGSYLFISTFSSLFILGWTFQMGKIRDGELFLSVLVYFFFGWLFFPFFLGKFLRGELNEK